MTSIPLSALQYYAFCPRQCALIHNEQAWAENFLTAQGRSLLERMKRQLTEKTLNVEKAAAAVIDVTIIHTVGGK